MTSMLRVPGVAVALTVLALTACNPDADLDEACGGSRPRIDECAQGLYWAHCDGVGGEPMLACHEQTGRCLWFDDGCVARDYRAVRCPVGNVCCETNSEGDAWAFRDHWQPEETSRTASDLAILGREALGHSGPAPIEVVIDPSVESPGEPFGVCTSGLDFPFCRTPLSRLPASATSSAAVLSFVGPITFGGLALQLEIVAWEDDAPFARAFVWSGGDVGDDVASCAGARPSEYPPQSGRLTLNHVSLDAPETMHGTLELTLEDRGTITIGF